MNNLALNGRQLERMWINKTSKITALKILAYIENYDFDAQCMPYTGWLGPYEGAKTLFTDKWVKYGEGLTVKANTIDPHINHDCGEGINLLTVSGLIYHLDNLAEQLKPAKLGFSKIGVLSVEVDISKEIMILPVNSFGVPLDKFRVASAICGKFVKIWDSLEDFGKCFRFLGKDGEEIESSNVAVIKESARKELFDLFGTSAEQVYSLRW